MEIKSEAVTNDYLGSKYGGQVLENMIDGIPIISFPFKIIDAPKGTRSFAWVFYDIDAYEVTNGFPWIHWVVANHTDTCIPENASRESQTILQGVTSWHSALGGNVKKINASFYGGPTPPNKDHNYTLVVYALDKKLDLKQGFFLNDMVKEMKNHILDKTQMDMMYEKI